MTRTMIYAANWKMCLSFSQAMHLIEQNQSGYSVLASKSSIIVCPSATALKTAHALLADTGVAIGSQNCSAHKTGAFTGQLAAIDLASAGATYCIVGHAECRASADETPDVVAQKVLRVTEAGMTPIICVGETAHDFANNQTEAALHKQLEPLLASLGKVPQQKIIFAYEPVWAIGTGRIPTPDIIANCFSYLMKRLAGSTHEITLLYGGSVSSSNAASFKTIPLLGGFLIGSASLDFQEFKKIVEC